MWKGRNHCPLEEWRGVAMCWLQKSRALKYVVFRENLDIKIQENIKQNLLALTV